MKKVNADDYYIKYVKKIFTKQGKITKETDTKEKENDPLLICVFKKQQYYLLGKGVLRP